MIKHFKSAEGNSNREKNNEKKGQKDAPLSLGNEWIFLIFVMLNMCRQPCFLLKWRQGHVDKCLDGWQGDRSSLIIEWEETKVVSKFWGMYV